MPQHGKKYEAAVKTYDSQTPYPAPAAMAMVKEMATAKFDETVEAAFGRTPDAAEARLGDRQGIGGPTALV